MTFNRALHAWFRPLLLAVALLIQASGFALAQTEQSIVVLVNDEPITNFDVTQRVRFYEITQRQTASAQDRERLIEDLIVERIQLQEAKKAGIPVSDEMINNVLDQMAKRNNMSVDQLGQALGQLGANIKTLRDRTRAQIAWSGLVRRKFQNQINIGAADVDRALAGDDTSAKGEEKVEFHLHRVHLDVASSSDQKALSARLMEAERLRNRFTTCAAIEGMVKQMPKTSNRDVGRKIADEVPQPTRTLLLAAAEGQMTPPTVTASGIEVYAVCSRRVVKLATAERGEVRAKLVDEEFQRLARGYLGDIRAAAFVERLDKKR